MGLAVVRDFLGCLLVQVLMPCMVLKWNFTQNLSPAALMKE